MAQGKPVDNPLDELARLLRERGLYVWQDERAGVGGYNFRARASRTLQGGVDIFLDGWELEPAEAADAIERHVRESK